MTQSRTAVKFTHLPAANHERFTSQHGTIFKQHYENSFHRHEMLCTTTSENGKYHARLTLRSCRRLRPSTAISAFPARSYSRSMATVTSPSSLFAVLGRNGALQQMLSNLFICNICVYMAPRWTEHSTREKHRYERVCNEKRFREASATIAACIKRAVPVK